MASEILLSVYGYQMKSLDNPLFIGAKSITEIMVKAFFPSSAWISTFDAQLALISSFDVSLRFLGQRHNCIGTSFRVAPWNVVEDKGPNMEEDEGRYYTEKPELDK